MTNKKRVADQIADDMRRHMLDILKVSRGSRNKVFSILKDLETEMVKRLAEEEVGDGESGLSNFQRERFGNLLSWSRDKIQETYAEINDLQADDMTEIADVEAKFAGASINKAVGVTLVTNQLSDEQVSSIASEVLIQGAPSKDWWDKQAKSVEGNFADEMRKGMMQGETLSQMVGRVRGVQGLSGVTAPGAGVMTRARKNAEALVRTSALTVAANARREIYAANSDVIKGIQQLSTFDDRTTVICVAYSGAAWDLDLQPIGNAPPYNGGVPRHWGCRSVEIPILRSYAEILNDPDLPDPPEGKRASMDGEVAADKTFDEWLRDKEEEEPGFARNLLGAGKSELWKAGKITLQDLVGPNGEEMTLAQLREKEGLADPNNNSDNDGGNGNEPPGGDPPPSGGNDGDNVPEWKPTMSREDAETWAQGSAIMDDVYHTTAEKNIESIKNNGFNPEAYKFGKRWGAGSYVALDTGSAALYDKNESDQMLKVKVMIRNPLIINVPEKWSGDPLHLIAETLGVSASEVENILQGIEKSVEAGVSKRPSSISAAAITMMAKQKGHDGIIVREEKRTMTNGGNQVVVFDKEQVVVIK